MEIIIYWYLAFNAFNNGGHSASHSPIKYSTRELCQKEFIKLKELHKHLQFHCQMACHGNRDKCFVARTRHTGF